MECSIFSWKIGSRFELSDYIEFVPENASSAFHSTYKTFLISRIYLLFYWGTVVSKGTKQDLVMSLNLDFW